MIAYSTRSPTLEEFSELRRAVNWRADFPRERIRQSLDSSPFCITAFDTDKQQIIGMVRISGDNGMYGYIQDTIVIPEYQHKGIGTEMLKRLLKNTENLDGYLLGVCPSKVSVKFYEKFGFKKRPEEPNGFMYVEVKK